jgi:hypothetical protein
VLNQIGPNGAVSLATALQAYALVFGPLPGVQSPANPGGLIPSGTLALRMILQHYRDLTPAQQQAVLQRLGYDAPKSAQAAPSRARVAALAQPQSLAAAVAPGAPTPVPTDGPGTGDYRAFINEFIPKLNSFLSFTFTEPIVLAFDPKTKAAAYAEPHDANNGSSGPPVLCRIFLNPVLNTYAVDDQRFVMGHELMHCYEAAIQGSLAVWGPSPDWLIEGAAEWAGALVSGATGNTMSLQSSWDVWLSVAAVPLFQRAYSAIGFYALLDHAGISPWSVLPAMLTSQSNGPNNLAAYQAGTQPAPQEVLDEWASSYERDTSLGLDWDLTGPGIVAAAHYGGPPAQAVALANGQASAVSAPAYAATDYHLTSQAEVVEIAVSGTSRLHDSASVERVTSANGAYCTKQGGCKCPDGSAYQGPALTDLTGLVHLAVTGGLQGASGSVSGLTLQQFCSKQKPKSAPTLSVVFCQQILSLAEANQFMQPPVAATSISIDTGPAGGSCQYEYKPCCSVVTVTFLTYRGATDPQSEQATLAGGASEIANGVPGATVDTTPVNDIPDAALFIAAHATSDNVLIHQDALDVIYGNVLISCANFLAGSASDSSQLSALHQVCKQVVTRLDP